MSIIYSECAFEALGSQPAMRMWHTAICGLPRSKTCSHKRHDFRKNVTEHKMCVLSVCTTLSETFLILRKTERDVIKHVIWSSC